MQNATLSEQINCIKPEPLRAAFDALNQAAILFDADGTCILANTRVEDILADADPEDFTGRTITQVAEHLIRGGQIVCPPSVSIERLAENYETAVKSFVQDADVELASGHLLSATSSPTADGGYLVTFRDQHRGVVNERRTLELLSTAFGSVDMGMILWDATLRVQMCNAAWRDLAWSVGKGCSILEANKQMAQVGLFDLGDGQTVATAAAEAVVSMHAGPQQYMITKAADRTVQISTFVTQFGGVLATAVDITERKRAEERERDADALVRKIVEASPTTFLVTRVSDGHILYSAPASRERFGPITKASSFFLEPDARTRYLEALLPTGKLNDYPVKFRRSDGTTMDGLTSARVTEFGGEQVIVSSTRDITEQLAMQKELERQREYAHQTEKLSALGELLAGVSHELNNPLSVISGYALMLQESTTNPKALTRINRISSAADRCIRIVDTFLAMARQRHTMVAPCQLNDLLSETADLVGHSFSKDGIQILLDLQPDLPLMEVDADQLGQVFMNLMVNAQQALKPQRKRGELMIRTYLDVEGSRVVVEVSDNGPGIPPEAMGRIFEPFFTTKEVGMGTGIGLAFADRIVSSHGGQLTVASSPEGGATFRVKLPCRQEA